MDWGNASSGRATNGPGMLNWLGKVKFDEVLLISNREHCHNVLIFDERPLNISCAITPLKHLGKLKMYQGIGLCKQQPVHKIHRLKLEKCFPLRLGRRKKARRLFVN